MSWQQKMCPRKELCKVRRSDGYQSLNCRFIFRTSRSFLLFNPRKHEQNNITSGERSHGMEQKRVNIRHTVLGFHWSRYFLRTAWFARDWTRVSLLPEKSTLHENSSANGKYSIPRFSCASHYPVNTVYSTSKFRKKKLAENHHSLHAWIKPFCSPWSLERTSVLKVYQENGF